MRQSRCMEMRAATRLYLQAEVWGGVEWVVGTAAGHNFKGGKGCNWVDFSYGGGRSNGLGARQKNYFVKVGIPIDFFDSKRTLRS
eukprot:1633814-Pleurochrysis_carterae.AAC.2